MDNKAIETLSISAVRDSIDVSDYLSQYIADNDKEPSWDGFVYIYNDKSKEKCELKGRLPVQIKGTLENDHSKDEIRFPISTTDLTNYLYDGGIVFFVVYIDNTGTKKQIYYVELPPIKIRVFLNEAKGQKSKTITLKKFPDDSNKKAMIFFNCLEDCLKQASFCSAELQSLDALEKAGILESVSISVTTVGGIDLKTALLTNEIYLYANTKGSTIPQPIEIVPKGLMTKEKKAAIIAVGDRVFYTKVNVIQSADTVTTWIGESFSIVANSKEHTVRVSFNGSDNLRSLVVDLDFMLSFIENKSFKYDDLELPFDESGVDLSKFDLPATKKRLNYLKKIVQALDNLGCNKDLSIKRMTPNDWENADFLVKAFVDKVPISGLKVDLPPVVSLKIADLTFIIALSRSKNEPGTYTIYDFFKTELIFVYDNINGEKLPISQYALLHTDGLLKADNIRYDVLLPSFQKIPRHSELIERTNYFLLELIEAYDRDNSKTELLTTASAFADWIMGANEEELPYDVRLLNKLQVVKRMGDLTITQLRELYRLVETPNKREDVLVGAYLLLGQQAAAELHFEKMDQETQEAFRTYPIYHFWKEIGGRKIDEGSKTTQ